MKLLRSELASEFNNKFFDMSAREFPERGMVFADDHISCELSVTSVQFGFQISGEIKATTKYECVRCLCACPLNLTLPFKMWLTHREKISDKEQDLVYFPDTQDHIELNEPIADMISLAEPMNPICNENCKGLCPQCGTNLNQTPCDCKTYENDSPWDALKILKPE